MTTYEVKLVTKAGGRHRFQVQAENDAKADKAARKWALDHKTGDVRKVTLWVVLSLV